MPHFYQQPSETLRNNVGVCTFAQVARGPQESSAAAVPYRARQYINSSKTDAKLIKVIFIILINIYNVLLTVNLIN